MSSMIRLSVGGSSVVSANSVGQSAPSSRFARSLKPSVAYLALDLLAVLKWQTILAYLAQAGIPQQVREERDGRWP